MALTDWQKKALDNLIKEHFSELVNADRFTTATLKELAEELNFNIAPASFRSALDRVVSRQSDYILHSADTKPVSHTEKYAQLFLYMVCFDSYRMVGKM